MAIEQVVKDMEQIEQDNNNLEAKAQDVVSKIQSNKVFKSLELPGVEEQVEEEVVEEQAQEPVDTGEEVSEETQEEPEEELIPKSKIQPRFDKLTAKIKELESKLETQQPQKPVDDVSKKLEGMSEEELRILRRNTRAAQIEATNKKDLDELLEFEDKIEDTLRQRPQRFQQAQASSYSRATERVADELAQEGIDLTKAAPQLLKAANEIYSSYPNLQKDVDGQAIALELAAKHFKEVNRLSNLTNKTDVTNLKQQVNTLKKKTALDTKVNKANVDVNKEQILRRKALNGTIHDKREFIKNSVLFNLDAQIPEEYKGR